MKTDQHRRLHLKIVSTVQCGLGKKETFLLNCTFWLQEGFFLSELFPVQTLAAAAEAGFPYTNILAVCAVDRFLIDWPNTHAKRDCCSFLQKILKIGFFYTYNVCLGILSNIKLIECKKSGIRNKSRSIAGLLVTYPISPNP